MPQALLELIHQKPLAEDFKPQENILLYHSYKRRTDAKKEEKYSLEESKVLAQLILVMMEQTRLNELTFLLLLLEDFVFLSTKNK